MGEHESLLSFLYLAPVGLVHCTLDGGIVMLNPVAAQLLMPLSCNGELNNLFDALHDVAPGLAHSVQCFADRHGRVCDALRLVVLPPAPTLPGTRPPSPAAPRKGRPQTLSLSLLKLDDARLMAVIDDVSEQVRRERMLEQGRAWFDAVLTGISDYALVRLDAQGRVDGWNASIGRVTGLSQAQVQGQPYSVFYPPGATTPERVADRLMEACRDGWSVDDGWRRRADGSRFWGTALIAPTTERDSCSDSGNDQERAYHLIIRDIGERPDAAERLLQSISRDHLTGLANRRAFYDAAELEMARWQRAPRPLSLVLFDADHFKAVNDRHGHPVGDLVLQQLAAAMQAAFRGIDMVARIGGEEFAVLLPSTDTAAALVVAERLRQQLADQALVMQDGALHIRQTVSAGIAGMDAGAGGLQDLLQRADEALYAAKAAGRNRSCCWSPRVAAIGSHNDSDSDNDSDNDNGETGKDKRPQPAIAP